MIVQDLLRPLSCFPVRSIRSPAKSQLILFCRSPESLIPWPRAYFSSQRRPETLFLLYRLRTLRLFASCFSIPFFLWTSSLPDLKNYILISQCIMGELWQFFAGNAIPRIHSKNIISLKSPLRLQTSTTARFGKLATTHVGTILILIPSAFREEVIIDFRLARLASDCKLSPLALKKALFISQKAKHASLLWGMLVICRFPGLMMPFHHQTAKNISSKKENQQAKLRIRSLDLLASSLGHVVERIRFRANAVISESQLGF